MKKKGEEEIIGFVMIILIVSVIILIFLGISIKKPGEVFESSEIYHFLESSMEYTTECATSFVPDYSNLGELFRDCHDKALCLNGKSACEILNSTLKNIIEASWKIGDEFPVKAYEFSSYYQNSGDSKEEIILISRGNCTGSVIGNSYLTPAFPGKIINEFKVCY